jgi:hypothetical protein
MQSRINTCQIEFIAGVVKLPSTSLLVCDLKKHLPLSTAKMYCSQQYFMSKGISHFNNRQLILNNVLKNWILPTTPVITPELHTLQLICKKSK